MGCILFLVAEWPPISSYNLFVINVGFFKNAVDLLSHIIAMFEKFLYSKMRPSEVGYN